MQLGYNVADPDTILTGVQAALHPHRPALPTGERMDTLAGLHSVVAAHKALVGANR
ncbi:hypothetical protein [Chloroflexus sp.]|uniref:hypothetical protein n=1 Tax=Chloroflexus sp. TaxID=1904827 RepID=UPI00404B6751